MAQLDVSRLSSAYLVNEAWQPLLKYHITHLKKLKAYARLRPSAGLKEKACALLWLKKFRLAPALHRSSARRDKWTQAERSAQLPGIQMVRQAAKNDFVAKNEKAKSFAIKVKLKKSFCKKSWTQRTLIQKFFLGWWLH